MSSVFICPVCNRAVSDWCKSIFCDCCNLWIHQNKCFGLSVSEFNLLSADKDPWFCCQCINTSLPFSSREALSHENVQYTAEQPTVYPLVTD